MRARPAAPTHPPAKPSRRTAQATASLASLQANSQVTSQVYTEDPDPDDLFGDPPGLAPGLAPQSTAPTPRQQQQRVAADGNPSQWSSFEIPSATPRKQTAREAREAQAEEVRRAVQRLKATRVAPEADRLAERTEREATQAAPTTPATLFLQLHLEATNQLSREILPSSSFRGDQLQGALLNASRSWRAWVALADQTAQRAEETQELSERLGAAEVPAGYPPGMRPTRFFVAHLNISRWWSWALEFFAEFVTLWAWFTEGFARDSFFAAYAATEAGVSYLVVYAAGPNSRVATPADLDFVGAAADAYNGMLYNSHLSVGSFLEGQEAASVAALLPASREGLFVFDTAAETAFRDALFARPGYTPPADAVERLFVSYSDSPYGNFWVAQAACLFGEADPLVTELFDLYRLYGWTPEEPPEG